MHDPLKTLFKKVADLPALSDKFAQVILGKENVVFDHVADAAQPFLLGVLAHLAQKKQHRILVVCKNVRAQEQFHAELLTWNPEALLFPHMEVAVVEGAIPDPEISAERLTVLQRLAEPQGSVAVVISEESVHETVSSQADIRKCALELKSGTCTDRDKLIQRLTEAGYENVVQVSERGQFSVRGGIMDVYSTQHAFPVRLEWFDDEIESIREFELDIQKSFRVIDRCSIFLKEPTSGSQTIRDYFKKTDWIVAVETEVPFAKIALTIGPDPGQPSAAAEEYTAAMFASPLTIHDNSTRTSGLHDVEMRQLGEQLVEWNKDGYTLGIIYSKASELEAVEKVLQDFTLATSDVIFLPGATLEGFYFPAGKLAIVTGAEIIGYAQNNTTRRTSQGGGRRALLRKRTQIDFTELAEDELVVHLEYGLARFRGLQQRRTDNGSNAGSTEEVMVLEFADNARLYVPLEQAFLVSRYVGLGKRGATLSHIGDGKWSSTKQAAEKSIYDYAAKLLKVQALRETHSGFSYAPDGLWQKEFEDSFPYKETADQVRAINETKADMESGRAMDRLICGDVGFGKTEVAIRAAFKAVASGKQVAMMVPTTVLAQQHYENFSERMARFPIVVELISRYRSRAEQNRVVRGLHDGSVDLVIGTHRLISKDVEFKDLGLLIVDEEQRFGVRHKERIKERFPHVDVLTLSATPIPRTLYLALTGARALSTLETAPPNRYPVETIICPYDERIIRTAIDRELDRQGQVYLLHNRVDSIEKVRARVGQLCPRARVDLGHGQMEEGQLEEVMHRFVSGQTDVLVATTIIESGLDIPNANTIIIDRADRFGLADLYQLRGRVGRGHHKAYAYLMLPRDLMTVGEARKRINAIKQYSALGAGFKIALRDLEIRGAGNILGLAQSGHLTAIGFDLYCQLLKQAVSKLRGEKVRPRLEVTLKLDFVATSESDQLRKGADLDARLDQSKRTPVDDDLPIRKRTEGDILPAFLPSDYIEEPTLRIQAYRHLAEINRSDDLKKLEETWRDRFGRLPAATENLLVFTRLKLAAATRKIEQIEVRGEKVMLTRNGDFVLSAGKFPRLTHHDGITKMREIFTLIEDL